MTIPFTLQECLNYGKSWNEEIYNYFYKTPIGQRYMYDHNEDHSYYKLETKDNKDVYMMKSRSGNGSVMYDFSTESDFMPSYDNFWG